ncbi:DUF3017 domain-containing protein [Nonomuraea rhizosphaerae]|uniref:DUF3017 domain-containing protein n=1 Tax=Nonomuraea rhizosphaerae TaxID=2665663 RepID=UPI001C5FF3B7|nr:DUF3017 domain-containing protein [Nonomuraea rhizosphaerae]
MISSKSGESWGPYPLVLAGTVIGVVLIFLVSPKVGGFTLGATVMVAAALRFAGYDGLAVRSKRTDVITLGVSGFVIVLTSMVLADEGLKRMILSLLG